MAVSCVVQVTHLSPGWRPREIVVSQFHTILPLNLSTIFYYVPEIKNNPQVMTKFHPQFWQGEWLCCGQEDKLALGCEEYNLFGDSEMSKHTHFSHALLSHTLWFCYHATETMVWWWWQQALMSWCLFFYSKGKKDNFFWEKGEIMGSFTAGVQNWKACSLKTPLVFTTSAYMPNSLPLNRHVMIMLSHYRYHFSCSYQIILGFETQNDLQWLQQCDAFPQDASWLDRHLFYGLNVEK